MVAGALDSDEAQLERRLGWGVTRAAVKLGPAVLALLGRAEVMLLEEPATPIGRARCCCCLRGAADAASLAAADGPYLGSPLGGALGTDLPTVVVPLY